MLFRENFDGKSRLSSGVFNSEYEYKLTRVDLYRHWNMINNLIENIFE